MATQEQRLADQEKRYAEYVSKFEQTESGSDSNDSHTLANMDYSTDDSEDEKISGSTSFI